jgi:hypothetical protein
MSILDLLVGKTSSIGDEGSVRNGGRPQTLSTEMLLILQAVRSLGELIVNCAYRFTPA